MKIALDKQLHFFASFTAVAVLANLGLSVWIAFLVLNEVGIAKEIVDSRERGNYFSWGDLLANLAGSGAYVALVSITQ